MNLVKLVGTKGIDSPEFKKAFKEFTQGLQKPASKPKPSRKHKTRGAQTNGKRKDKRDDKSFPPRSQPYDDEV
jgi:hypothetical protein